MHNPGHPLYLPLRLLHILGAMVFLGALLLAVWWKLGADRSGDPAFAARVHRRLRKADAQLVGPSAFVIFASGYAMVRFFGGRIAHHMFVLWGLILLTAAVALWYFGMRNLGESLAAEAEASETNRQPLSLAYAKRSAAWLSCALAAVALVVLTVVFMVYRLPSP